MKRTSKIWPLAILGIGVFCVGATFVLAAAGTPGWAEVDDPDRLRVVIRLPSSGTRVAVGSSVLVLLEASSPEPVARYELWVDGERERVVLPEAGEEALPSSVQVSWRPADPGPRLLIARAFSTEGGAGRSRPVIVEAERGTIPDPIPMDYMPQPGDTLETLSASLGVPPADILAANPGWSGEVEAGQGIRVPIPASDLPDDFLGDDQASHGEIEAPADFPPPPLPEEFPTRPGLPAAATGEGCRVSLEWALSERSDGYRVYRYGSGDADFTAVGESGPAEPRFDDIVPLAGAYQYLIAAYNRQGISESDPSRVEVTVEDCPAPPPADEGMAWLDVELLSFTTDLDFDRTYCYASPLPGTAYQRIPSGDDEFLTPSDGMWDIGRFAAGIGRLGFLQPADRAVRLQLECWGWQGGVLSRLGSLDLEHPKPEWDGRDLSAAADRFAVAYRLLGHTGEIPQMRPVIFEAGPPPPEFFRRPDDPAECLDGHTFPGRAADAQARGEVWASVLACLSVDPHDLSVWEWTERADPRYYVEDLRSFRIYVDRLGRDPEDVPSAEWELFGEVSPAVQTYPILRPPCEQTYTYWATAVGIPSPGLPALAPGGGGPGFDPPIPGQVHPLPAVVESGPSNALDATGPDCPVIQEVLIDISLDSIDVGRTWDSCFDIDWECEDVSLETYGWGTFFRIRPDGSTEEAAQVRFWRDTEDCAGLVACMGLGWVAAHETIHLGEENMEVCDVRGCMGFAPDTNHIQVWVGDGDDIGFEFALRDDDDASGDDIWCGTSDDASGWGGADKDPNNDHKVFNIGARSAEAWAGLVGRTGDWNNNGLNHQDADCTVNITVSAVEVSP